MRFLVPSQPCCIYQWWLPTTTMSQITEMNFQVTGTISYTLPVPYCCGTQDETVMSRQLACTVPLSSCPNDHRVAMDHHLSSAPHGLGDWVRQDYMRSSTTVLKETGRPGGRYWVIGALMEFDPSNKEFLMSFCSQNLREPLSLQRCKSKSIFLYYHN